MQDTTIRLLSRRELALRWDVSLETIKRRTKEGLLRPIRFNARLIRYRLDDVLAIEREASGEPVQKEYAFAPRDQELPTVGFGK
jgi:hypothetical protein